MIVKQIDYLLKLNNIDWGYYAFTKDPLNKKISNESKEILIENAINCGKVAAINLMIKYPNLSIYDLLKELNIKVIEKEKNSTDSYIMFACYNSPNKITIFNKCIQMTEDFISQHKLTKKLGDINVKKLLLAHELFHFYEEHTKDIYTQNEKIVLWKIGKFKYRSKLIALSEIAAMAFAKELLSLKINPFIFDFIMLYPQSPDGAYTLFNQIKGVISDE